MSSNIRPFRDETGAIVKGRFEVRGPWGWREEQPIARRARLAPVREQQRSRRAMRVKKPEEYPNVRVKKEKPAKRVPKPVLPDYEFGLVGTDIPAQTPEEAVSLTTAGLDVSPEPQGGTT